MQRPWLTLADSYRGLALADCRASPVSPVESALSRGCPLG